VRNERSATAPPMELIALAKSQNLKRALLLPGAFLVTVGAELLAAFMFVDLRFTALLQ
jgi:hypothetical protein